MSEYTYTGRVLLSIDERRNLSISKRHLFVRQGFPPYYPKIRSKTRGYGRLNMKG